MPLSIKFPLYGSTLVSGPYNVSLSLPGPKSIISKSIGLDESSVLLVPNINYITKFVEGNLGISDNMFKSMLFKNLSNPLLTGSEQNFNTFIKNTNTDVGDIEKLKDKNGKIKVRESDIKFELPNDIGLKAFETITLKSIFETQKPYMDLASIVIESLSDIEDIIARLAPLLSTSPLTTISKKPSVNGGSGNKPKSIGFKENGIKKKLQDLNNLSSSGTGSDGSGNIVKNTDTDTEIKESNVSSSNSDRYEIISTVYSTGQFDPTIDYKYIYIDLPPEINTKPNLVSENEDDDAFDKYKPKTLVFGIYKQDGTLLNPNEKLKAKVIRNGKEESVDTPFKKASWILQSDKWKLGENVSEWPSFSEPYYVWKKGVLQKTSKTKPNGFDLKKYKKGDKNLLTKNEAIEGNPVISRFENVDKDGYLKYYKDELTFGLYESGLPKPEQNSIKNEILKELDISSQLENTLLYGQLSQNSVYKNNFPQLMRKVFKPYEIHIPEAESDEILKGYYNSTGKRPGMVWINPETDYKLKVIKVKPATSIEVNSDTKEGVKEIKTITLSKNNTVFKFTNNEEFNVKLTRNLSNDVLEENGITEFSLSNWNYVINNETPNNNESYNIEIWGTKPFEFFRKNPNYERKIGGNKIAKITKEGKEYFYREYIDNSGSLKNIPSSGIIKLGNFGEVLVKDEKIIKWFYYKNILNVNNLPNTNEQKTFNINFKTLRTNESTINIPTYFTQTSENNIPGKIINPSELTKEILTNSRFSTGKYGHGSEEEPQEVDTIKRFMVSEYDTETYYIIEGILDDENDTESTDSNSNKNKSDSGNWYKLPDALGVFKKFIKLIIKIFSKIVPNASKIISLFGGPANFVVDILVDKLGEHFGPLSSDSIKKLKASLNVDKSQFKNNREFIKAKQKPINESRLKNFVYIDESNGNLKTLLDGRTMIPFSIFGANLPFGMDLKMGEVLKRPPVKLILPDFKQKSKLENLQSLNVPFKSKTNANNLIPSLSNGSLSTEEALRKLDQTYPFNTQFNIREEVVSVRYSTGEYIPGVDYNYIYVTEDVKILIDQADELIKKGDDESILKANQLINQAIDVDPKNNYIKGKKNLLKNLLSKIGSDEQPLFKLLLGIVTLPIKIVAGIVEWILKFFKSLVNPFTLPIKVVELLSFKWILDFFTPKGILNMAGIKFDPSLITQILSQAFTKKPNGEWLFDDNKEIDNVKDIMDIFIIGKLPVYTYGMIRTSPNVLSLTLKPILGLMENIINGIIKFIWSILGIEAIIKPPKINLTKDDKGNNLSAEELSKIMNNDNIEDLLNPTDDGSLEGDTKADEFVYEIKLPNGEIVRKASLEELNKYIEENSDFKYEKNF